MSSSKDTQRSQRRRELDARRSKSRVRLGSCLQSWGQLKEKLGFSLHSELAQHLLERYIIQSSCSVWLTARSFSGV
uniref:Zinc finger protein 692 n=1 Tax=Sinocyclocheilus anshuiensis TaxID=1608454 RepID=A0A671KVH5_9TELE